MIWAVAAYCVVLTALPFIERMWTKYVEHKYPKGGPT